MNNDGFTMMPGGAPPLIESNELQRADFDLELDNGSWTSVYIVLTPKRDIKEISLNINYFDSNKNVIKKDSITSYDLKKGQQHRIEMKNSIFESLKMRSWQVVFISGTRA